MKAKITFYLIFARFYHPSQPSSGLRQSRRELKGHQPTVRHPNDAATKRQRPVRHFFIGYNHQQLIDRTVFDFQVPASQRTSKAEYRQF